MSTTAITEEDLVNAARQLAREKVGRQSMRRLLAWLNDGGLNLDGQNRQAVMTLLCGAWGSFPGTARDVMEAALSRSQTIH